MAEIERFIDPAAEAQIEKYLASLQGIATSYDKIFTAAVKTEQAITKISRSSDESEKKQRKTNEAAKEAERIAKEQAKAAEALQKQRSAALIKIAADEERERKRAQAARDKALQQEIAAEKKREELAMKMVAARQKEIEKEQAFNNALTIEVKTIKDAQTQNSALNKAKKEVDTTTTKGKETIAQYNAMIDKNNKLIRDNESAEGKRKMSIGQYAQGVVKAAAIIGAAYVAFQKFAQLLSGIGKIISDFSTANSKLASVLGTSKLGITELAINAMKLGATTKYTAAEVTGLQVELAKLGKTKTEILAMTKSVLKLAAATDADLGDAAKVTGVALNAFGMTTKDTERAVSAMAVGTARSALSFADYETILSTTGAVAKVFGFTLEDTIAMTGKLKDAGFDASKAATATRNIFLNMADSSGALAQALGRPVTSLDDMVAGMQELNAKGIDLATMLDLTDKRSVAAFATFVNGGDKLLKLRDQVTGVTKELDHMVEVMEDNLKGDKLIFTSAWEGFILALENGEGWLSGTIRNFVQFGTAVLTAITPFRKLSTAMVEQKTQANALATALMDVNLNEEAKYTIYTKLKEIAPDVVEGIDSENVSIVRLNENLVKYNKNQINKIILQRRQEDIDDAYQKEADAMENLIEKQQKAGEEANKLYGSIVIGSDKVKSKKAVELKFDFQAGKMGLDEYLRKLAELNGVLGETTEISQAGFVSKKYTEETQALNMLTLAQNQYNETSKASLKLTEERNAISEKLGMAIDETGGTTNGPKTDEEGELTENKAKAEKLGKAQEEAAKKLYDAKKTLMAAELKLYELQNSSVITKETELNEAIIKQEQERLNTIAEMQINAINYDLENGKITEEEAAAERLEITVKNEEDIAALRVDMAKQTEEKLKEIAKQKEEDEKEAFAILQARMAESSSYEQRMYEHMATGLRESLASGVISRAEYEKAILDLDFETTAAILENTIRGLDAQLQATGLAESEKMAIKTQIAEAEMALDDTITQHKLDNKEKEKEALLDTLNKVGEVGGEVFNILGGFMENESIRMEQEKERQLAAAGDNAIARERIEKEFAIKQAQIKRKQAIVEKVTGIFSIAINTAKAIMEAAPNIPLMALMGILGAAQIAVVATKPLPEIPKFAKGTKHSPAGVALVGEAGRELLYKDGKASLVDKPTYVDLSAGTQVLTNRETERILQHAQQGKTGYDSQQLRASIEASDRIISAINNKRELNISASGDKITDRQGNYYKTYFNRRIRWAGR